MSVPIVRDNIEIPTIYQRVEYLQGNGSTYIDLGVNNKTTFGVRAKASNIPSNLKTALAGACNGANAGCGVQISLDSVKFCAARQANSISLQQPGSANGKYVQANFYGSGKGFVEGMEDTTTITLDSYAYANTNHHFLLFAYNDYQGVIRRLDESYGVRWHHFQLTDGPDIIMDLYPCYRKSDGKPGMWDVVGWKFYENAGSGADFTVGPDVIQPATKYIVFEDRAVEAICVANWSSDGIGLTYEDAATVTDLGLVFKGTSIASFDELQYFTGLTAIAAGLGWNNGGAFGQCLQLVSVTLPDTITTLGAWCFGQCQRLTNFVLPDSVTRIERGALYNTLIRDIEIPAYVTTLGETQSGIDRTVVMRPTTPMPLYQWGETFLRNANLKIYVPYSEDHSILDAYKATRGWEDYYLNYLYELNPDGTIPNN